MIVFAILFILACLYWAYWIVHTRHLDTITKSIRGPPALPIIGHALLFLGNTEKILKNINDLALKSLESNGVAKIWLGPRMYIAITNPVDAQVVLENCLDKDGAYRFLRPWLGQGLFVASVNLWKHHRKVLLPVFNNKIVEEYVDVIAEQANILVERLSEHSEREQFDVLKYVTACTLDVVFETAMGERMSVQRFPDTPYLRARNNIMTILNMRIFKVWMQPDCLFNMTKYSTQQKTDITLTHQFTDEVVQKRRTQYENLNKNEQCTQYKSDGKLRTVLDILFGSEFKFTDEQLREHIDSITIAGNDTTALVISYTLVLLGKHQDSQERALQEQIEIFGDSLRGAGRDDLNKMHYLERVIKESMRLYTVVPIIGRNVDKDTYLPSSGVTLPAGVGAIIASFALHKSEAVWGPNVHEYEPDRFLPERSASRHPAAFLPFSYGSRNCIGRNFGMLIMKCIICAIIRSYSIKAQDVGKLKIEMLLFPVNGHLIKIEKRKTYK